MKIEKLKLIIEILSKTNFELNSNRAMNIAIKLNKLN